MYILSRMQAFHFHDSRLSYTSDYSILRLSLICQAIPIVSFKTQFAQMMSSMSPVGRPKNRHFKYG